MRLDNIVLIAVLVVGAMIVTTWVSTLAIAAFALPFGWVAILPALFVGYIVWRVVADRLNSKEDDYYDHIEK